MRKFNSSSSDQVDGPHSKSSNAKYVENWIESSIYSDREHFSYNPAVEKHECAHVKRARVFRFHKMNGRLDCVVNETWGVANQKQSRKCSQGYCGLSVSFAHPQYYVTAD